MPNTMPQASTGQKAKEFFMGTPGQQMQFQRFNPQQQDLQNQSIQQLLGLLRNAQGNQQVPALDFAPIGQNIRENFATKTAPTIAERFAGFGQNKRSGALESALAGAGRGLESDIGSLESKFNLAASGQQGQLQNQLLQLLLSIGMQPSFENAYSPSQPGFLHGLSGGVGSSLGTLGALAPLKYFGLI